MDPDERLTCEQLLQHEYFDKPLKDMYEKNAKEEQSKRARRSKLREQQASRTTVVHFSHLAFGIFHRGIIFMCHLAELGKFVTVSIQIQFNSHPFAIQFINLHQFIYKYQKQQHF